MTPQDLLDAVRESGLNVHVVDGALVVDGVGHTPTGLLDEVRRRRGELTKLLVCARCSLTDIRLIPAYWGPRFCPSCCAAVVDENDRADRWPPFDPKQVLPP